ncbi:MAG: PDZ domain-containing protein [Anaerolineae bacterium]
MERKASLSYVAIALIVLASLACGFLGGGLVGGVAGYALARYQGLRAATTRLIVPPEVKPEEIVPFELTREARPYLGIRYQMITPQLAEEKGLDVDGGALVVAIEPESPAERAGLREGDVITAVNGQAVDDDHPLGELIRRHEPGDEVELTVVRQGRERSLRVELGARREYFFEFEIPPQRLPEVPPEHFPLPPLERFRLKRPYLGIRYQLLTPELAEEEGLNVEHGALVREVMPESPAERAGLRKGDVIVAVDGQTVDDHPLSELVSKHEAGDEVELTVVRQGRELSLTAELGAWPGYFFRMPPERFRELLPRFFRPDSAGIPRT